MQSWNETFIQHSAWNEEELIGLTIGSIQESAKSFKFEIIVADDDSNDRTSEIANSMGTTVVACNNRQLMKRSENFTQRLFSFVNHLQHLLQQQCATSFNTLGKGSFTSPAALLAQPPSI